MASHPRRAQTIQAYREMQGEYGVDDGPDLEQAIDWALNYIDERGPEASKTEQARLRDFEQSVGHQMIPGGSSRILDLRLKRMALRAADFEWDKPIR